MIITHKLKMNLEEAELTQRVEMPMGDVSTRQLELLLYSRLSPWTIPEGVTVLIRYKKADGTMGEYDTMPDGTAAWSVSDNALTVCVAPQVLTAAGSVLLYATLYLEAQVLHTFSVEIDVRVPFVSRNAQNLATSQDYYYVTNVLRGPVMAQAGQVLTAGSVDAAGRVTEVAVRNTRDLVREQSEAVLYTSQNLGDMQKLQARNNIGAASQAETNFLFAKFTQIGIAMTDDRTGELYSLYVRNGKLILEKEA